jgi:hypothetical protein
MVGPQRGEHGEGGSSASVSVFGVSCVASGTFEIFSPTEAEEGRPVV